VPSLQAYAPELPSHLDDVCRRALAHDRNRRYRNAAEMGEALERAAHAEGGPGVASPRELGKFVEELMGAELAAQREAVRGFLAHASEVTTPTSRGPRSMRAPSSPPGPRTASDPRVPASREAARTEAEPPRSDEPPETPAPQGEKVPRLSAPPEPAAETPRPRSLPPPLPSEPPRDAADAPPTEAPLAAPAEPPAPLAARLGARLPPPLRRLLAMRLSHRAGVLLVVALVTLALAPLAYKAIRQRARGQGVGPVKTATPRRAPAPQPTAAWDEWPVPSATPSADDAP
jgi:hypothetical protein